MSYAFHVAEKATEEKILDSSIIHHLLLRGLILATYCSLLSPH